MTLFDVLAIALIAVYTLLGMYTGLIRRVLGMVILFGATVVGTFMAPQAGSIWQQYSPSTATPDARLYGFLLFFFLIVVVTEAMATAIHEHLQLSVIALDRFLGTVLGFATGMTLVVVMVFILAGYAQPVGGGQLSSRELDTHDQLNRSRVAVPLVKVAGPPVIALFQGALPHDPQDFFRADKPI